MRNFFERMRHAPLWVWLTVLLTAGLLVFAYLQYKKSATGGTTAAASQGTVPANGSGQPLWSTADTSGMITGNGSELQAILAYINSLQTPNAPTTAAPGTPSTTPTTTHISSGGTSPAVQSVASAVKKVVKTRTPAPKPAVITQSPGQVAAHLSVQQQRISRADQYLGG